MSVYLHRVFVILYFARTVYLMQVKKKIEILGKIVIISTSVNRFKFQGFLKNGLLFIKEITY